MLRFEEISWFNMMNKTKILIELLNRILEIKVQIHFYVISKNHNKTGKMVKVFANHKLDNWSSIPSIHMVEEN